MRRRVRKTICVLSAAALIAASSIPKVVKADNANSNIIYDYPYVGSYWVLSLPSVFSIAGKAEVTNQVAQVGNFTISVQGAAYKQTGRALASYSQTSTEGLSNYVYVEASSFSSSDYVYVKGNCTLMGGVNYPDISCYK